MESLKEKTAKGLFWGAISSGGMQLLNVVIGIFLARLLTPDDYGVVGMLAIFSAIAGNIQDSGFSTALVNLRKATARDYNAVFWFSTLMSITLYALLFACAPLIATFFHEPTLIPLSRFIFLGFVLAALGVAHSAYMFRNLMNKQKALLSFTALLLSGTVGIVMALRGMGCWSLAWQQVLYIGIVSIGKYAFVPWRPSLKIDFSPIRRMFGFSNKILITTMANTVSQNLLTFIFGRLFNARVVGLFNQAYKWNTMASQLVAGTVAQVAQPVFSQLNDDPERQLRAFRKMLRFTAFLAFPAMFGLALVAREFIIVAISEKWTDSVPLLQMLCVGGAFLPFHTLYQNLMIGRGRSDVYMWCTIAQIIVQTTVIIATYQWGINVMVAAFSLLMVAWVAVWQHFARRAIGLSALMAAKDTMPYLAVAAAVMAITWLITKNIEPMVVLLVVRIVVAALLYLIAMKLLGSKMFDECMSYLLKKKK